MITQPIIGSLTDKFGMRPVNMVMFAATCVAAGLFVIAPNFLIIVFAYAAMNLMMNGVNPTVERMATSSPYSYGSIRVWGSIGFAVGTQLTGIIYDNIAPVAPYVGVIIAMLIAIFGFWGTNPRLAETEAARIEDSESEEEVAPASTKDLLTNKKFLYYLVLQILFSAATGAAYSFCPAFLTSKGLEASTASTFLAIATLLEIPLLLFSSKFMDKIANKTLLLGIFALVVIEMVVYGLNLPLPLVIVATFLGRHPPAIINIMKEVNTIVDARQQIASLALVKTCQSFGTIISNNIGGRIVDAAGYPAMFLFLLALVGAGLAGVIFFQVPSGNDKKLFS